MKDSALFQAFIERIARAYILTQSNSAHKEPAVKPEYNTIDEYIALFPDDVREILAQVRQTIRQAAPDV
ncbi:hypothetical protein [Sporotomaculum syntrophicum]|uniref:hypothetical protein n=1 Tax=Sporotomaculum syntrophicum TaxID=182264 RepID=UPI00311AA310